MEETAEKTFRLLKCGNEVWLTDEEWVKVRELVATFDGPPPEEPTGKADGVITVEVTYAFQVADFFWDRRFGYREFAALDAYQKTAENLYFDGMRPSQVEVWSDLT